MRFTTFAVIAIGVAVVAQPSVVIPSAPDIAAKGFILIDAETRKIIAEKNSTQPLAPASLTKIMTSYAVAAELESGRVALSDRVPISVKAWKTPGSRMFVREGTEVLLEDLLKGVVIQSGNDASVALAEYIAGSESAFADLLNQHAISIDLTSSQFENATGLPNENHYSTARDMALLTRELIRRFPEHYSMYAQKSFKYGDMDPQFNRNRLLWRDRTVDGVKTGKTNAAGWCLVASAKRDGMRLISVVMGANSESARITETQKLLSYGFRYFQTQNLYDAGIPLKTSRVWYGEAERVSMGVPQPVFITIPRGRYNDLEVVLNIPRTLEAPISVGDELGTVRISLDNQMVTESPLVALEAIAESGFFARLYDGIYLFFKEFFS